MSITILGREIGVLLLTVTLLVLNYTCYTACVVPDMQVLQCVVPDLHMLHCLYLIYTCYTVLYLIYTCYTVCIELHVFQASVHSLPFVEANLEQLKEFLPQFKSISNDVSVIIILILVSLFNNDLM